MSDAEAESTQPADQQQQQGSDSKQQKSEGGSSSGGVSGLKKILLFVGIVIVFCAYIVDSGAYISDFNTITGGGDGWGIQGTVEILLPALLGLVLILKSDAVNVDITTFIIFFVGLGATLWSFFDFIRLCRIDNKSDGTKTHIAGRVAFFVGECLITIVGAMGIF